MANTILIKHGSGIPTSSNLKSFELGYSTTEEKLYINQNGIVKEVIKVPDTTPIGLIAPYAGDNPPENWLKCDGSSLNRNEYSELYSVIGTLYGSTSSTNFSLPDLRGRFPIGISNINDYSETLGQTGGSKDAIIPSHTHTFTGNRSTLTGTIASAGSHSHSFSSRSIGSGGAHTHSVSGTAASAGSHTHISRYAGIGRDWSDEGGRFLRSNSSSDGALGTTTAMEGGGAHTHSVSGTAASAGSHSHRLSVSLNSNGAHTHTLTMNSYTPSGSISTTGVTTTDKNLPPYITLNFIIKAK